MWVEFIVVGVAERGKQAYPGIADLLAPEIVVRCILQDTLKQKGQFGRRPVAVFFGELDHRILNDVERRVVVAHGVDRLLERASFDARQKIGEFLV